MTDPSSSSSTLPARLRKCSRCDSPSTLLLRKNVPSCTPCAQRAVEQRAKGILEHARGAALLDRQGGVDRLRKGKGRGVDADGERGGIALGFSGGGSSRALLNVATRSLAPPPRGQASTSSTQPRKARPVEVTRIDVIYIDDSALVPGALDQTEAIRDIISEQGGEVAGMRFVPLKLEDVFGHEGGMEVVECLVGPAESRQLLGSISSPSSTPRDLLLSLFRSIDPPSTSRASASSARTRAEDLQALLTQVLLVQTARSLGDAALLLGDNASRGAINLIDGIAKGRGHKWPVEGAAAIWRDDLLVLRPLRDCFAKELAFYNRTLRLSYLAPQDLVASSVLASRGDSGNGGGAGEKASIGRLTENFIFHLEKGVPSTVNTVGRTGGKLVMAEAAEGNIAPIEATLDALSLADSQASSSSSGAPTLTVGTGQKGNRLVQGVKALPRWNGLNACPLCGLPAQKGASDWKGKLSIVGSLDSEGRVSKYASPADPAVDAGAQQAQEGGIELEKLLCYACLILLDVPEEVHVKHAAQPQLGRIVLPLPGYVLDAARARQALTAKATGNGNGDGLAEGDGLSPFEPGSTNPAPGLPSGAAVDEAEDGLYASADKERRQGRTGADADAGGHVTRKIGKEEMRGKVGAFLLADGDGDGEREADAVNGEQTGTQ